MPREEALDRAEAEEKAAHRKVAAYLLDGRILLRPECGHDGVTMRIDAPRTPVAAQRLRSRVAMLPLQRPPPADACCAYAEPFASFAMRSACRNRRKNPNPEIDRQRFRQARRPPIRRTV